MSEVRNSAAILIFDGPTASLDLLTEKRVLETLFKNKRGRTILLITHRQIGLENVDTILVMQNGQIVELNGLCRRLWDLQNQITVEVENANI